MEYPARFVNLDAARERHGDRVDRLAPYFFRVDPLADDVVLAMEAAPANGFRAFGRAAAEGIVRVPDAPAAFRPFFEEAEEVPVWVDWEALDRGGEALLRAGPLGGLVLAVRSLVLGYASPGGNKPLVFTGRLAQQAPRRLNETARFVQATCKKGGLRRFGDGYQISLKVRLMHAHVRRMILKSGRWQADLWGAPLNQHDMVGTSMLFSAVLLDGLRQLGVYIPRSSSESYMHLWRYSAHLMGIAPELIPNTEDEARRLAMLITDTQGPPDDDARALTAALLNAPLKAAKTRAQQKNGLRQKTFATALCRELVGTELADQLGVERTTWRLMVPFMRRFVSGMELVRVTMPLADVSALWAGNRYWDRVVEIGLSGAPAEFTVEGRAA
jgi:hypothetical protein